MNFTNFCLLATLLLMVFLWFRENRKRHQVTADLIQERLRNTAILSGVNREVWDIYEEGTQPQARHVH